MKKKNHDTPIGEFLKNFWKIFEKMVKKIHLFQKSPILLKKVLTKRSEKLKSQKLLKKVLKNANGVYK